MKQYHLFITLCCAIPLFVYGQEAKIYNDQDLLKIELAFSALSASQTFHDANLAYAADDAVVFRPLKTNAKEWSTRLKAPDDSTFRITWYPSLLMMSAAGDLGFGTGPFDNVTIKNRKPDQVLNQGQFVTVWKRQADGQLKFMMDFGSGPLPVKEFVAKEDQFVPGPATTKKYKKNDPKLAMEALLQREREYSDACQSLGDLKALQKYADNDIRFFYQTRFYARGLDAASRRIADQQGKHQWTPAAGTVAESDDLAHIYGTHQYKEGDVIKEGYYMRVWKKVPDGSWKIIIQVRSQVQALPKP